MAGKKTIRDFFMKQTTTPQSLPSNSNTSRNTPKSSSQQDPIVSNTAKAQLSFSSSLSPPPSSDTLLSATPAVESSITNPTPGTGSSGREVRGSDDEEDDSDSSLEELQTIFASKSSTTAKQEPGTAVPSTPTAKRIKTSNYNLNVSPLAILPKYKSDLKSLVKLAQHERETEESAQRVKALNTTQDEQEEASPFDSDLDIKPSKLSHGSLLASVVAQKEEGGLQKVTRALMRTESTNVQKQWYFFSTEGEFPEANGEPFPSDSLPEYWTKELKDPEIRHQTFISGFAEDMIEFGNILPDELFMWILNAACIEQDDVLRTSYYNVLKESAQDQTAKLVAPNIIEKQFSNLGATSNGIRINEDIIPITRKKPPSSDHDWSCLRSFIRYLILISDALDPDARELVITLLVRMMADNMLYRNVDLLVLSQTALRYFCKYVEEGIWEATCQRICKLIFKTVKIATICLQIVEALPSTSPRIHDLRRRLALCFFYSDDSHAEQNPHYTLNISKITRRLTEDGFQPNQETDYVEFSALIALLDIAVDDGRNMNLDLKDKTVAERYDEQVELLIKVLSHIHAGIGNPGAAFISRIEAKETLEVVRQRFTDTLRARPKAKLSHFAKSVAKVESLGQERAGMSAFLARKRP